MSTEKTQTKKQSKKCEPLKCQRFLKIFEKVYDKAPVDAYLMGCGFRNGANCEK